MGQVQLPSHFTPTHETEGLPGFPAVDVFAPAGTQVLAPATGKVVKLSGHPPTATSPPGGPYGWSIYLTARDGGTYYMTHFGSRNAYCKVGACIGRGEPIGKVAAYSKATHGVTADHIHLGYHKGVWAP